jgi:leucyl aminopeptidase
MKIALKEAPFPSQGSTLLYTTCSDTIKKDQRLAQLNQDTKGRLFEKMKRMDYSGKKGQTLILEVGGMYDVVVLTGLGDSKKITLALLKKTLGSAIRKINSLKMKDVQLYLQSEWGTDYQDIGETIGLAAHLASYAFTKYKSNEKTDGSSKIDTLDICIEKNMSGKEVKSAIQLGLTRAETISKAIYLSRDLINEPPSHMYPETLAVEAKKIAKESKGAVTVKILEEEDCEKLGMGSYLAVAQGSEKKAKFIVLKYVPKNLSKKAEQLRKKIALVGKTVTFDTGGYQVKPGEYMNTMKSDMSGGAAVLGVFKALANWDEKKYGEIQYEVFGILAACENMISGEAFRPDDIVTAMNGKTIEIIHTDAEGRLTLADALSYAENELKADIAIDLATLTGAMMVALGHNIAGVFGNDEKLREMFVEIANDSGEDAWEFPLPDDMREEMKGDVSDLKNLGRDRYGGAITAALFLEEFVGKMRWVHVDFGGPAFNTHGPKGVTPKGGTGWGVQTLIQVITTPGL